MKRIAEILREPSIDGLNVDSGDRLAVHSQLLARKRMLREVFSEFHELLLRLDHEYFTAKGLRVEIGAGVAPIKHSCPDVLATDILPGSGLDRTIDAENMDLESGSVRVIFGQNCFHHFPHPERFFHEVERVTPPGGGAILIEPYHGPFASFLYKRLFTTEGFDKNFSSWEAPTVGPMNGANQALSYIVFERDRKKFEKLFPNLRIVHQSPCTNYLKYLLSGGLNFRQLLPDWTSPLISGAQLFLSPLDRWMALHHVVVLRKELA